MPQRMARSSKKKQATSNKQHKRNTTMADESTDANIMATTSQETTTDSMDAEITEEEALEMATNLAAEAPMMGINETVMPPRLIITKMVRHGHPRARPMLLLSLLIS